MGDPVGALRELGSWAASLELVDVPRAVVDRLELVLLDHLGVTLAGARTPEGLALAEAVEDVAGVAPLIGHGRRTSVDLAAWLNGTLACSLELDEGNKHARGHPAAHAFPAVLADAASRGVSGETLLAALLAAYEVGARAGAATTLHPGTHPHGNWGALGAAAGIARLRGLDGEQTAAAIDAAAGLCLATPFATATEGNLVRNAWVGHTNQAGFAAVRLAQAGHARVGLTATHTLGRLLGELDTDALHADLGTRWLVTEGYFKRHASCSFTHPPVDAVLALVAEAPDLHERVERVEVATHRLAAGLAGRSRDSRLAAMFSTPVVVAVALLHGAVRPAHLAPDALADDRVRDLAERIAVVEDPALTARLPGHRAARVTVTTTTGETLVHEVSNPVGDVDHHPFGRAEVEAKLAALLGAAEVAVVVDVTRALATATNVTPLLHQLP